MSAPLLATKLYLPVPRQKGVARPSLIARLNEGMHCKLTLVSAPAGFGKTTLLSQWLAQCGRQTAWLALDEGDNDPTRFLTYLIAALQNVAEGAGKGLLPLLQSTQAPPLDSVLTNLINEITTSAPDFVLTLDDYHVIETEAVDRIVEFLIDHMPPQMHLAIATREDPPLPLARLRVRNELNELRVSDLRFTRTEATGFLNEVMGLQLSEDNIAALEARTEGWAAGLQLAAISMRGQQEDITGFIEAFTGSHHFVLDYLLEEVLHRQPQEVQTFLLQTSVLNRLCGPLCDALLPDSATSGQATLESLERANLFLIPLDSERYWYRYHHLFADLLRQRLPHNVRSDEEIAALHIRASAWFEANGLDIEAFHHATAANDMARAERLIEGDGMPLHFRGAQAPVLNWLESLPAAALDAYPSLWTTYASVLLVTGQPAKVPQTLQSAEAALQKFELDDKHRDLVGRVAAIRATLAANQRQAETVITQSRIALDYLHPDNQAFRIFTIWKLGYAYQLQGDRAAARQAYADAIFHGEQSGNAITTILATIGLATLQEKNNLYDLALENYARALQLTHDLPLPFVSEVHLGMARIYYERDDLPAALQSIQHAQQINNSSRFISCAALLARVKLAQGDPEGATAHIAEATQYLQRHDDTPAHHIAELVDAQVHVFLRQGNLTAADQLAQSHNVPLSQAQVHLAQGNIAASLALLDPLRLAMAAKGWIHEQTQATIAQSLATYADGQRERAIQLMQDALTLAEPGGLIRSFLDQGAPMAQLLAEISTPGLTSHYVTTLLAAFEHETQQQEPSSTPASANQELLEPLSERELEVLQLIAQGCSNQEISQRLFLALNTVKGHNRNIFGKLQVQRRTEAVARARELGLL